MVPVQTKASFGRIAAQTAKQVILQRIREAERETLYSEFVEREGDLITGTVQSVSGGTITLSLGRAEAVMPRNQQIPKERYRPHDKVRALLLEVKRNSRGPQIVVSRAHKMMLRRDRKSTRLNSSHVRISYAVFCLKKKKIEPPPPDAAVPLPCPERSSPHIRSPPEQPA